MCKPGRADWRLRVAIRLGDINCEVNGDGGGSGSVADVQRRRKRVVHGRVLENVRKEVEGKPSSEVVSDAAGGAELEPVRRRSRRCHRSCGRECDRGISSKGLSRVCSDRDWNRTPSSRPVYWRRCSLRAAIHQGRWCRSARTNWRRWARRKALPARPGPDNR